MKVYAKFSQPPATHYWSMTMSSGGEFITCRLHWDKPTGEKEFESMDEFYKFCDENGVKVPWREE